MNTDDTNLLPAVPDPAYVSITLGVVRGLLQIASGLGFGWALAVTGDQATMIATALVMVGTLLWSAWQKIQAERRKRNAVALSAQLSAQASAQAGAPIPIAVTATKEGALSID